jgi:DMSO/TMAO reductase YedYZ molybdopterin-dependent catalytic subunit
MNAIDTYDDHSYDDPAPGRIRDRRRGAIAGMIAAVAMLAVIVFIRRATGVTSLLDALADALLLALPISLFSFMLDTFGPQAKTLLLTGLVIGMILLGGILGRLFAIQTAGSRRFQVARAAVYGIGVFLVTALFTIVFLQSRLPSELSGGRFVRVIASLGLAGLVFGAVLGAVIVLLRRIEPAPGQVVDAWTADETSRRRFVTTGTLAVVSLAGAVVLGREVLRVARRKSVAVGSTGELPPVITPIPDFYTISKNFVDPDPNRGENWSFAIDGLVTNPLTLTRQDLEAMPVVDFVSTLTCISNPLAGPLIGTATWTGTSLAGVLSRAGVGAGAVKLIMEGEDGYTDSIPIERSLSPEPMVVWKMNGEPLPKEHGMPVRLIVPGLYGIKNVKWLTKLTVTNKDYEGYWQQRGWTDDATIKTQSRIDEPGERGVISAGPTEIRGMAFAGDRGISRVEVSTDAGESWREASIFENPSPGGLSWVFWSLPWVPAQGTYELVVRATDGMGELQTAERASELPDGASGWHRITVGVA